MPRQAKPSLWRANPPDGQPRRTVACWNTDGNAHRRRRGVLPGADSSVSFGTWSGVHRRSQFAHRRLVGVERGSGRTTVAGGDRTRVRFARRSRRCGRMIRWEAFKTWSITWRRSPSRPPRETTSSAGWKRSPQSRSRNTSTPPNGSRCTVAAVAGRVGSEHCSECGEDGEDRDQVDEVRHPVRTVT